MSGTRPWDYGRVLLSAPVNTGSTNTIIVTGVTNFRIKVYAYTILCAAATTASWNSSASGVLTTLSGGMPFAANGGAAPSVMPPGTLFETAPGASLALAASVSTAVAGHVSYFMEQDG